MKPISFVILQYNTYELTRQCIDSIHQSINYDNYSIIVVDNHSQNDASAKIRMYCAAYSDVYIIDAKDNLGFAKGNNLGYDYALHTLHASFVVCINNDTELHQADFLNTVIALYEETSAAVIGPDIVTPEGIHQNPYRLQGVSYAKAKSWRRKRFIWTSFLRIDQIFKLRTRSRFIRSIMMKRNKAGASGLNHTSRQMDIVLQGACLIFTPAYIEQFPSYAFFPETFLYCEEDILYTLCQQKMLHTCYAPELTIQHKDGLTAKSLSSKPIQKEIFESKYITRSLGVLIKVLKHPEQY